MRLLYVTPMKFGEDIHAIGELSTASALAERGWQVTFLAPSTEHAEQVVSEYGHQYIGVKTLKMPGLNSISFERSVARELPQLIDDDRFDVIMSEWRGAGGTARAVERCRRNGTDIRWVMEDRSPPAVNDLWGRLQWLQYRRAWKRTAKRADGISVLVPALEEYVRRHYDASMPMVHCPSGVDIERFHPSSTRSDGSLRLLYHGSLYPERNVERLIEVGDLLAHRGEEFTMRIFGMGPSLRTFESAASSRTWLEVLGTVPREDVTRLVRECHIGLIPWPDLAAWQVGSPLKLFEYAASGLTTVATDVRSHLEVAPREWLSVVSNANLVEEMADAITQMWHRSDFPALSAAARRDVEQEFTWMHATEQVHRLLLSLSAHTDG